eukprot:2063972-Amphidinium_carterae.3
MGWDEQSAQESHAQQNNTNEKLQNFMSSITQTQPQQTPTLEGSATNATHVSQETLQIPQALMMEPPTQAKEH